MSRFQNAARNTNRRRAVAVGLTAGLALIVAVLTLTPIDAPQSVPGNDKIHHVLAFAALTLPTAAFYPQALYRVVLAAAVYGAAIEVIQPFVGRSGELADFFADLLGIGAGAGLGLVIHLIFSKLFSRRTENVLNQAVKATSKTS